MPQTQSEVSEYRFPGRRSRSLDWNITHASQEFQRGIHLFLSVNYRWDPF